MTHPSTPRRAALATLVLATMTAAACGHSSPAAPDNAASSKETAETATSALLAAKHGAPSGSAIDKFPLLAGTFTIANRKGDQINGIYSGETVSGGDSVTTLRLEVQNGTGNLAGATGVLDGKGRGAFTGEGQFSLDVSGSLGAGDGKKRTKFDVTLRGWANIGCDAGKIVITLNGDAAHAHGELRHEVANAGCGS